MEENGALPSESGKRKYLNEFMLLGKIGQLYVDNRKMIKSIIGQLQRDRKGLDGSCYPLSDTDKRDVSIALTELMDILTGFLRPKDLERYNISVQSLKNYVQKLEKELDDHPGITVAQRAIDIAKDTAKNLSDKIGKGVAEVKKTVQGITSK